MIMLVHIINVLKSRACGSRVVEAFVILAVARATNYNFKRIHFNAKMNIIPCQCEYKVLLT